MTLALGATSMTNLHQPKKPRVSLPGRMSLPETLQPGDYVLGGTFRKHGNTIVASRRLEDLVSGLVLRIVAHEK